MTATNEERQMKIITDLLAERDAQDALFGVQDLPFGTGPRFEQEANDYRYLCDRASERGTLTMRHVFLEEVFEAMAEDDPAALRAELVQAVAVGIKFLEIIDRATARAAKELEADE